MTAKGSKKPKPQVVQFPLNLEQINTFWKMFRTESDRGCVLTVGSIADVYLEGMLRREFEQRATCDVTKHIEFLLTKGPVPPLRSTFLKMTLAFCLGLLDESTFDGLHELTLIRNRAAHPTEPFSLASIGVSKLFSLIKADSEMQKAIWNAVDVAVRETRGKERIVFESVSHCLMFRLNQLASNPQNAKLIHQRHMWEDLVIAVIDEERSNKSKGGNDE